ncbi:phage holin family protein [Anaerobacillus sp. MEB173]|uniref:phage holin family protein n=1 Tax=Anaerobacillus sp. MEB173 TaxID=3383345 RepID=UPI003F8DA41D
MLTDIFTQVQVHPQLVVVVPALMIIGYALKKTPKVKDWMIIWILLAIGVIASCIILGFSINGIANGIIAAGAAITTHQAYKQTMMKRTLECHEENNKTKEHD